MRKLWQIIGKDLLREEILINYNELLRLGMKKMKECG